MSENTEPKKKGRKPKEKSEEPTIDAPSSEEVIENETIELESIVKKEETIELKTLNPIEEEKPKMKEVVMEVTKKLSYQAQKWSDYLKLQSMTPERFLEKYPVHLSRTFVQEIIDFEKTSNKENI